MDEAFWAAYTDRQPDTNQAESLRNILKPWLSSIHSALEVGCNRGDNLGAFDPWIAYGVEPNRHARKKALGWGFPVLDAKADNLPFGDDRFDLVFTVGVLIHISPEDLDASLREIHRVAKKFILAIEYDAPDEEPVDYRGVRAGIWKRPYGDEYMYRFMNLDLMASGDAPGFDGCKFWLFEKVWITW